jgi:hypothetical protein
VSHHDGSSKLVDLGYVEHQDGCISAAHDLDQDTMQYGRVDGDHDDDSVDKAGESVAVAG